MTYYHLPFLALALAFTMLISAPAMANVDDGLYDPVAPEGSAFIRFLNNTEIEGASAELRGKTYGALASRNVSPYYIAKPGVRTLKFGAATTSLTIETGNFYTVILDTDGALHVTQDPRNDNRAKAHILFYNLTSAAALSLKTKDGKTAIIKDIAPFAVGDRQINPVKLDMAVYNSDAKLTDVEPVSLERGKSYSAITLGAEQPVLWLENTIDTTK